MLGRTSCARSSSRSFAATSAARRPTQIGRASCRGVLLPSPPGRPCHSRGIPHVTLEAREHFLRAIVEPFVRGYERGETPNPCISCNGFLRFVRLLAVPKQARAARLVTRPYGP